MSTVPITYLLHPIKLYISYPLRVTSPLDFTAFDQPNGLPDPLNAPRILTPSIVRWFILEAIGVMLPKISFYVLQFLTFSVLKCVILICVIPAGELRRHKCD